jgi:hypothetical protein
MAYGIGIDEMGALELGALEIGARRAQKVVPKSPYGNTIHIQQDRPRSYAYQVFGLGSSTLGAAGATTLNQVFQEPFRPERLVLSDSVAGNSVVNSIFIGVKPQMANNASFPAVLFGAGTFETRIAFDCGQPGQNFLVNLTLAAAGTISGGAFGSVIK